MKPPSGGPSSGPISAGMVTQVMASTRLRLSTLRISTSRPTGAIMAPPMPCTKRAITKLCSESESAQPIDPMMKTAMARRKTVRAPNRSAVQPLPGMKIASASR